MKISNFSLLVSIFFLISCSGNSNKSSNILKNETISQTKENKSANNGAFMKVHSLKKNDSTFIGDVYVKFINDTIFTDLCIVNKTDTLYSIKKNILANTEGKDIKVYNDGFYGYKFVLKKNDYIVLSYLRNKGANVSDDITIKWNYDDNLLEVPKVP